jgi:hypothetical protein
MPFYWNYININLNDNRRDGRPSISTIMGISGIS